MNCISQKWFTWQRNPTPDPPPAKKRKLHDHWNLFQVPCCYRLNCHITNCMTPIWNKMLLVLTIRGKGTPSCVFVQYTLYVYFMKPYHQLWCSALVCLTAHWQWLENSNSFFIVSLTSHNHQGYLLFIFSWATRFSTKRIILKCFLTKFSVSTFCYYTIS